MAKKLHDEPPPFFMSCYTTFINYGKLLVHVATISPVPTAGKGFLATMTVARR